LAGFLWLWLASALADAALSSVTGVLQVVERSRWAASLFLFGAAFTAAIVAIAVAHLHRRWGSGTLRATWIVGFIDIFMGVAAIVGVGSTPATASLSEGAGYLAAAAVFAAVSSMAIGTTTDTAA
jgi:hypothetical protein